ncbi:TetR family transcriptional regulator [Deinococcus sp. HMF7620]|uniref:TetR family transcriptional regulator n=1 Tax=Deinococcus arboris TaxID=2682977 RepID=A0A7C9LSN1_9DEIO|nr:TetR/AcrR family transcriptional regulator [Deinococcus arboris]MVN86200.1 TetR family transcriptional regulator [Deinococcus arboris]
MTEDLALPGVSRRERHKQDKQERLRAAAFHLFTQQGYEATTIRQIADEADLATGTVFRYATDKADLLLMVFHDVIARTAERALAPGQLDGPLPEVLPQLFEPFFEFYQQHQVLSKDFLRLTLFHQSPWRDREMQQARDFVDRVGLLLRDRQATGEVAPDLNLQTAALAIFALYQVCLVGWLTGGTSLEAARAQLAALLHLHCRALRPSAPEDGA